MERSLRDRQDTERKLARYAAIVLGITMLGVIILLSVITSNAAFPVLIGSILVVGSIFGWSCDDPV